MQILTGDIGGTNTRLATVRFEGKELQILHRARFPSAAFASLNDIVRAFQEAQPDARPTAAAFGVAGPVYGGVSRITNLPWTVSAKELADQLGTPSVYVLNDLEALGWGIDTLEPDELLTLHAGAPDTQGNRAIIAAGTGLGQAGLYFDGEVHKPFATEGGHVDFSPSTEQDWALHGFLKARYGRVSWERVVSGPGMVDLFEFSLQQTDASVPAWFEDPAQDTAAAITERALSGSDELCMRTLHWFTRLYGAEAGNLALKMKATGGVYLGGGIAPRILPALKRKEFIDAFLAKGRMRGLLERTPVHVISNEKTALQGLARYASIRAVQ